MTLPQIIAALGPVDVVALILLFAAWFGISRIVEHPPAGKPSVTLLVADYRRAWMVQFARRETRIFDATLVSSLRQGTSYFASTSLIAIGAVLALIGNTQQLQGVAEGLIGVHASAIDWQVRLLPPVILLTHAFLKFVWSHRLFGYCSVLMGAVPADTTDPTGPGLAWKAGELNIRAAYNFNRGLRSMYFALGSLAWLVGPVAMMMATAAVVWLLWSREFASHPRDVLMAPANVPPGSKD